jgi:hypothetical protein
VHGPWQWLFWVTSWKNLPTEKGPSKQNHRQAHKTLLFPRDRQWQDAASQVAIWMVTKFKAELYGATHGIPKHPKVMPKFGGEYIPKE